MDLESILRKLLENVSKDLNYKSPTYSLKKIDCGGANYTSSIYSAVISEPGTEDLKLFAKIACMPETLRKDINIDPTFEAERVFYKQIGKKFDELQDKHNIIGDDRLRLPKIYAIHDKYLEDTLILEDLVSQGFSCYDRTKSIELNYALASVEQMAKYHALSFAYNHENPEEYKKLVDFFQHTLFDKLALDQVMSGSIVAAKDEYKDAIKKFTEAYEKRQNFSKFYRPTKNIVLVHGDWRSSNLMHKEENGKWSIIPIDFQLIFAGRPTNDLFYFIFTGTDKEFRDKYFKQLLNHYYENLEKALKRLGLDPEKVYPRQEFDEEVKEYIIYGLFLGVFALPFITADPDNAPDYTEDNPDFAIKANKLYTQRLNGIIDNLVEWGYFKV